MMPLERCRYLCLNCSGTMRRRGVEDGGEEGFLEKEHWAEFCGGLSNQTHTANPSLSSALSSLLRSGGCKERTIGEQANSNRRPSFPISCKASTAVSMPFCRQEEVQCLASHDPGRKARKRALWVEGRAPDTVWLPNAGSCGTVRLCPASPWEHIVRTLLCDARLFFLVFLIHSLHAAL